jgi:hypothetical protein
MAVSGGIVEYFPEDARLTVTVGATPVVAGRLVELSGDRTVIPAQANSIKVCGLALQSGGATGDKVAVATDGYWPCRASGAIAEGDFVKAGAAGVVVAIAADGDPRLIVGRAIQDIADGADGPIKLML